MQEVEIMSEIDALARINAPGRSGDGMLSCNVGGLDIDFKIDSGSEFNTISEDT